MLSVLTNAGSPPNMVGVPRAASTRLPQSFVISVLPSLWAPADCTTSLVVSRMCKGSQLELHSEMPSTSQTDPPPPHQTAREPTGWCTLGLLPRQNEAALYKPQVTWE